MIVTRKHRSGNGWTVFRDSQKFDTKPKPNFCNIMKTKMTKMYYNGASVFKYGKRSIYVFMQ